MALKGIHYIYYGYQISPRLPLPVYHLWLSLMNHYQYRLYTLRTYHTFVFQCLDFGNGANLLI